MSIRILLVDPDECLLATYRDFFQGRGFEVVTAANGPDCETAIEQFRPDVVVLEPELPDAWGKRLLESFEDDRRSGIPLLILTRRDLANVASPARMTLIKPVSLSWLASAIRALVSGTALGVVPGPELPTGVRTTPLSPAETRAAPDNHTAPGTHTAVAGL